MDEAIIIGILCLLLAVAACLFRNRGRRQTPRCSFSLQESGQDEISENHRMDLFSQECFPIIRAIQNKIQLIYQRCRWKSYSTVRVSTVSTQTDPCGQSEQMSVQRPLATNLSDSLTPQGPQNSHSTLIASYREATGQTPNPEAGRPAETGAEAGTKAITEVEDETDPPSCDAIARGTAQVVTEEVTDPARPDLTTGAVQEAETEVTDPARPDLTTGAVQEAETEEVTHPARTDSALQVPSLPFDFSHGQIPNDIDIHQNNKEAEDLGDDLQGSMFPVGNKEAEILVKGQAEILVKGQALKAGSKTGCGDTAGNEMSLNKKGSLNSLCDNETTSSSSNSEPTEQEESSKGYMGITDQSEIQLSKSQKTSKFEMGSLQRGQNQKIHEDKILRKKTDQGTQRMLFKGDTSKTYKLSQSIPPPKWETIDSEKTLSALSKPKQTNKWNVVSHLIGVVPDNHPLDAENEVKLMQHSYAKQRRCSSVRGGKDPAAGSKHTLSDSVSEYDADNEDSDPETAQPSYTKQKRSSSAQGEEPADVNAKCSGSGSLKKRGTVPDTTLDIIEEAPQTATMAATGVEPSQTVSCHKIQTELTLGHFSNSEPWKSDRKAGSEIESDITSVETDGAMADGSQNDDNGNLQVCGPEYTGDKERIQDEDGRNGGTSNPEDLGSIQDDNQKTNGSDDSKGNNSYSPPE